eukprot:scaffold7.g3399.t1
MEAPRAGEWFGARRLPWAGMRDSAADVLPPPSPPCDGDAARDAVLTSSELMTHVFEFLRLEDLCRAAMVRRDWRGFTDSPTFWERINLHGRTLNRHHTVRELDCRGVAFGPADLAAVLPLLERLESLELEKPAYEDRELEAISTHLPRLTRLVLAGGVVGSVRAVWAGAGGAAPPDPFSAVLAHPSLRALALEGGRTLRLRLACPALRALELRDFGASQVQLAEGEALESLAVADCGKMNDAGLRYLLRLEGEGAAPLPSLARLELRGVPHASDDTLRAAGARHTALTALALAACPALTGHQLAQHAGFAALRSLAIECCDSITGLSESVHGMPALAFLSVAGCTQLSALSLGSHSLRELCLRGTRTLAELDLRCPQLAEVAIEPLSPGLAAAAGLRRVCLASHAVARLAWAGFPALAEVELRCPNLLELDLSECSQLRDSVFLSLGPGVVGLGFGAPPERGCPRLRVLKLGECDGLRAAVLRSESLECLHLSQCRSMVRARLDCPALTSLALEECTALEAATLRSLRMTSMSLGTCPHLTSISVDSPSMLSLDLRGCNELSTLALACPALRKASARGRWMCAAGARRPDVDATFCGKLGDEALAALAHCSALEELVLAVCNSLSAPGLAALAPLANLIKLDLSYTPLEDPSPIYASCHHLTGLTLSSNYRLLPEPVLALFPAPPAPSPLPRLRELDISYCSVPTQAVADIVLRGRQLHCLLINGCREGVRDGLWPLLHGAGSPPAPVAAERRWAALECGGRGGSAAAEQQEGEAGGSARAGQGHQLRVLSMVSNKQLRRFRLGLAPAAEAAAAGLLPAVGGDAAVREVDGQRYAALPTELDGLEELRLSLCALQSLVVGLPRLQELQLNNCTELRHLVLACPSLARLSLHSCRLALGEVAAVVARLPALEEVDVQYSPGLGSPPEVAAALRAACPGLRAVHATAPCHGR